MALAPSGTTSASSGGSSSGTAPVQATPGGA
jgi:hypothetical protein